MNRPVVYARRARRELQSLDGSVAHRIVEGIERLASDDSVDIRRLRGSQSDWRLRVRDWRVIFEYQRDTRAVYIKRIRHRREAY